MANQHAPKISDTQFIGAFKQCRGNFAKTARLIEAAYGIPYSRQAVYYRVRKHPKEAMQMIDATDIQSMGRLMNFIDDESLDIRFRVRHYLQVMKYCCKMQRFANYAKIGKQLKAVPARQKTLIMKQLKIKCKKQNFLRYG